MLATPDAPETPTGRPGAGRPGADRPGAHPGEGAKPRQFILRHEVRATMAWLRDRLAIFDTPASSYYLILFTTIMLVVIGLVMVLSSSAVSAIAGGGSPFGVFVRQALYAALGLPLMFFCSKVQVSTWRRLAWPAVGLAVFLQILVFTPLGHAVLGNRNWIKIGPLQMQPSEAAKLALVLWCALILSRKAHRIHEWRQAVVPFVPVVALVLGLVLLGHDLGTGLVMMALVVAMLFVAGIRMRIFAIGFGTVSVLTLLMIATSANRRERIATWLSGECTDVYGQCWQSTHGLYALASGGWWGLGLGASREKWDWLPMAHNDYIYAIIGEELGLPGTLTILFLFALLAVGLLRIISRHPDPFVKIASSGVMAWIIGQALMNIGVVIGVLPVIGLPLPLVSAGGSALIMTLGAIGVVLSFARSEPEAAEVLAARVSVVRRSLELTGRGRGSR